jgi:hypothetical protein
MHILSSWETFYVIVGSCAGALIGLQFVVMTLVAEKRLGGIENIHGALATPTIVHFGVVLLLSAVASAPWASKTGPVVLWAVIALLGFAYSVLVAKRIKHQTQYQPVAEDWLFRVVAPCSAYAVLAASAAFGLNQSEFALFLVAAVALTLLYLGIHDAWDSVLYLVANEQSNVKK